jgi:hypothetical protein
MLKTASQLHTVLGDARRNLAEGLGGNATVTSATAEEIFHQFTEDPHLFMRQDEFRKMMSVVFGDVSDEDIALLWQDLESEANRINRENSVPEDSLLSMGLFVKEMVGSRLLLSAHARDGATAAAAGGRGGMGGAARGGGGGEGGAEERAALSSEAMENPSDRAQARAQARIDACMLWRPGSWFIRPDRGWRVQWDMWLLLLLFYVAVCVPLRIGFNLPSDPWNGWFVIDIFVDISFFVDMFFNFYTGFVDMYGVMQLDPCVLKKNYLGWPQDDRACCWEDPLQNLMRHELKAVALSRNIDVDKLEHAAFIQSARRDDGIASADRVMDKAATSFTLKEEDIISEIESSDTTTMRRVRWLMGMCVCCGCSSKRRRRQSHRGGGGDDISDHCVRLLALVMDVALCPVRGWFFVDFLSCFPISYLQLIIIQESGSSSSSSSSGSRNVRLVRILRLLRLVRSFFKLLFADSRGLL